MGRRNKNTFSKALGHLKSRKIDEKLQMLSERPANSTLGYMTAVGSQSNPDFVSTQQGQESAQNKVIPDFDVGASPTNTDEAKDTTGLFEDDGTLRVASPPGDNSYILGPMSAMWYAWANKTYIGYIRQADRKMVNLGTVTGKLSDWDGSSGAFNSYGQLTLAQAQWFRTIQKQPGATNDPDTYNYRAFYPGPPSNTPDAFGRYYCVTTGEPKQGDELPGTGEKEVNPGEGGPQDPDSIFSAIMARLKRGERLSNAEKEFLKNYNGKNEAEVESMMDKLKDHWSQTWEDVKNFPNDLKKFGEDLLNMIDEVTDKVPAIEYSKDIADSILSNEPKDNSDKISEEDKQKLYDGLNYDNVKINDKKETYADDNIIEDENGNVRPREKWPTDENGNDIMGDDLKKPEYNEQMKKWFKDHNEHPNNTGSTQSEESEKEMNASMGSSNPLAAAGQAQTQVYKNENGEWVFSYTDHAYHNINSKDEGEVPGLGFINPKLWISKAVHAISNAKYDRTSGGENTGGMEGYPPGIYGDSIKKFETKVSDMPKEFQDWFNSQTNQNNSYRPRGRFISESRKANIIRDLKKPVVIPETKQKSYKVKPKIRTLKTVISKPVATPEEYKPPMKMWGRYEYNQNVRASQERKNEVMNLLGEGEAAMQYRLKNGTTRTEQEMKEFWGKHPELYDFYFNNMNHRMLRKEQVEGGDFVVFLVAENGKKVSMSQSKLNEKLAEAEDQKLLDEYNKLNPKSEPISYEKDPLFKKVSSKLKPVINYPKKPSPKGYPDKAPPKLVNGFHPDLGKRYKYDKLDPQSAEGMPPQGNPEIDANIEKFTDKNAKIRKIKNLIGKKR